MLVTLAALIPACGGDAGAPADARPPDPPGSARGESGPAEKALGDPTQPVFRFAKLSNGAYFYTGSVAEKDAILRNYPDFRCEGLAFWRNADTSGIPVWRFANLGNGGYFYTASPQERDWVLANRPDLRFEGSSFAVAGQAGGAEPVYRLANLRNGAYLFTASTTERQFALSTGDWRDEGVAFSSPGAPAGSTTPAGGWCTPSDTAVGQPVSPSPDPSLAPAVAYRGTVILASPTRDSIRLNLYAPDQSGSVWISYGTSAQVLMRQTARYPLTAGEALEVAITGLQTDTQHFYSIHYTPNAQTAASVSDPESFRTARQAGSAFSFALQGDSHPERQPQQFSPALYQRTLDTAAADNPDFYILMGDDFSVDTLDPLRITREQVVGRYTLQRPYLGRIGKRAPLFLVNGNHEQAAGYLLDGTPNNVAVWAQNARNALYSQPAPDGFYTGNTQPVPFIGLLRNYYAWTWGDALFVVLDPYWHSPVPVDNVFGGSTKRQTSLWEVTHGDAQYQWLRQTLSQSRARYKFVFAHHVMGTGRGGIELAGLWEWGGRNTRGVLEFPTQRPGWDRSIHQLLVDNKVTIFFQGHDHIWVRQQLDGVTYQTVSEPADPNYALYFSDAYLSGDKFPNSGYTRVSVSGEGVRVDYVRSVLPADERTQGRHGSVVFSYTVR